MKKILITQGTAEDFFIRGKTLAKQLDRRERIKAKEVAATITFLKRSATCSTHYHPRA